MLCESILSAWLAQAPLHYRCVNDTSRLATAEANVKNIASLPATPGIMEGDLASEGKAMRRLMFFTGGVLCGVMIGAAVALLLAPASGDSMREDARRRFDGMMVEAQLAADKRRRELETQLAEMTTPPTETAIKPA